MPLLPYSILKSKRAPYVRIIESTEENIESKIISIDFGKQIDEIIEAGLFVIQEHVHFVMSNINYFYRNNLAVIFLTLNIMRSGDSFISSIYYQPYINFIARKSTNESFENKLKVEIKAYRTKIEKLLLSFGMNYI